MSCRCVARKITLVTIDGSISTIQLLPTGASADNRAWHDHLTTKNSGMKIDHELLLQPASVTITLNTRISPIIARYPSQKPVQRGSNKDGILTQQCSWICARFTSTLVFGQSPVPLIFSGRGFSLLTQNNNVIHPLGFKSFSFLDKFSWHPLFTHCVNIIKSVGRWRTAAPRMQKITDIRIIRQILRVP